MILGDSDPHSIYLYAGLVNPQAKVETFDETSDYWNRSSVSKAHKNEGEGGINRRRCGGRRRAFNNADDEGD